MSSNHHPSIWDVNKASAFIDAMNASHRRPRHGARYVEQDIPHKPRSGRSRHLIATFIGVVVFGGLAAANWIV